MMIWNYNVCGVVVGANNDPRVCGARASLPAPRPLSGPCAVWAPPAPRSASCLRLLTYRRTWAPSHCPPARASPRGGLPPSPPSERQIKPLKWVSCQRACPSVVTLSDLAQLLYHDCGDAVPSLFGEHEQVLEVEGAPRPGGVGAVTESVAHDTLAPTRHQAEEPRRGTLEPVLY